MTKLLACSDIHNNVGAVRQLRSREGNDFDAVIVAGDIGSENPDEIFEILESFGCPILYVFGNWDGRLEHDRKFGAPSHHLHMAPYHVGGLVIVGESIDGVDRDYRNTPSTESDPNAVKKARKAYVERQHARISALVASGTPERTIVVSHYRLTKTQGFLPGVPLFLYGHIHRFEDTSFKEQRFVNVSALDRRVTVTREGVPLKPDDYRYINDGSYVVISHHQDVGFTVEPRNFAPDFSGWNRVEGVVVSGAKEVE